MKILKERKIKLIIITCLVLFTLTFICIMIIKNKERETDVNNLIGLNDYADLININNLSKYYDDENIDIKESTLDKDLIQYHKDMGIMNLQLKKITATYLKDEKSTYTKFDSFSLVYENDDKWVEVIMSEEQSVFTSNFLEFNESSNEQYEKSYMNNLEILLFKENIAHRAIFEYDGVCYYIKTANFSNDEFIELIRQIIAQNPFIYMREQLESNSI